LYEIGCEEYFFGEGVCIIEWAEKIEEILPPDCIRITLEYGDTSVNADERIFSTNIEI
jgi:tRNA threonylcarbamoyladenosine biosynthesis protein TsaE